MSPVNPAGTSAAVRNAGPMMVLPAKPIRKSPRGIDSDSPALQTQPQQQQTLIHPVFSAEPTTPLIGTAQPQQQPNTVIRSDNTTHPTDNDSDDEYDAKLRAAAATTVPVTVAASGTAVPASAVPVVTSAAVAQIGAFDAKTVSVQDPICCSFANLHRHLTSSCFHCLLPPSTGRCVRLVAFCLFAHFRSRVHS
jgi:hypothetical protein